MVCRNVSRTKPLRAVVIDKAILLKRFQLGDDMALFTDDIPQNYGKPISLRQKSTNLIGEHFECLVASP